MFKKITFFLITGIVSSQLALSTDQLVTSVPFFSAGASMTDAHVMLRPIDLVKASASFDNIFPAAGIEIDPFGKIPFMTSVQGCGLSFAFGSPSSLVSIIITLFLAKKSYELLWNKTENVLKSVKNTETTHCAL